MEKKKVYLVIYSSDEGQGVESVHMSLLGAQARIKKVEEEDLDMCTYEVEEMALLP